ncbi:unnamed protein product [Lymnaea stagnalis]|uniref:protein-tyrosine-phosphatase n=1 Tax=Lymnaea stagnalis TaxID=6523 RepID=A0AAV2HBL5_LYMST
MWNSWICVLLTLVGLQPIFAVFRLHNMMQKCPDGYFGYKCKFRCQCSSPEVACDKVTGYCRSGRCKVGFWGPGCQLENSCYYNNQKRNYMGTLSLTQGLRTCQNWNVTQPHSHTYKREEFQDGDFPKNYCRVTKDSYEPWCYTTDSRVRWEHCALKNCVCPWGRFGVNCVKECHCQNSEDGCNSTYGQCPSGCAKGWSGRDCQINSTCPANRYGWECEQTCQCENSEHCDRFSGPTSRCVCKKGFFKPPHCEPVTAPRIVFFGHDQVNPGQPTYFNCTIAAYPTPTQHEIRLTGPEGKRITVVSSKTLDTYLYTRTNIFFVNYVMSSERYNCSIQSAAGSTSMSLVARVYELPKLNRQPVATHQTTTNITVMWHKWDKAMGDIGTGPVISYNVHIRSERETSYKLAGHVEASSCKDRCTLTIPNLIPNHNYAIYVTTKRDGVGGEGPPSPVIHAKTSCSKPKLPPIIEEITSELQINETFPKSKVVVKWKDPVISSINCNSVKKYILKLSAEVGLSRYQELAPAEVAGGSARTYTWTNLDPYVQHCAIIVLENEENFQSPESKRECIVTPQTAPGPPTNFHLRSHGSTTVSVSWQSPKFNFGSITKYQVIYWEGDADKPKLVDVKPSTEDKVDFNMSKLKANTYYKVQVKAENAAGLGQATQTVAFTTEEAVPGPVSDLRNVTKTTTSIGLQWQLPIAPNGELLKFEVSCEIVKSLHDDQISPEVLQMPPNLLELLIRNLQPATLYNCSVWASTKKGKGEAATIQVWTLPRAPTPPSAPEIIKYTENTATLKLHESHDRTISYYRIIVEKQDTRRKKRNVPKHIVDAKHDFKSAVSIIAKAYITAQFEPHRLRGTFVIGDNQTYDKYFNGPLHPDHKYTIWLGAYSNVDGMKQNVFVKADRPIAARSTAAEAESSNSVAVIIGVLIVILLLMAIIAVLVLIWRRRHIADEREKAEIPFFGPTIYPEPDTSEPPSPIGRNIFCILSSENIDIEPLINTTKKEILMDIEPLYCNTDDVIAPIKVEDLWDYIRTAKQNDLEGLKREFKLLPAGITATYEVARKNENKLKNRYGNIIAYDHTRVVLDVEGEDIHDDYINANYIDGYNKKKVYIAAQGPSKPTLNDIWRMVWKENSKTIIMLTNSTESGKKKCDQYWPDNGCEQYGNIVVQLLNIDILPDFTIRTFLISKGGQSKYVKQFHYTTWPDHGVPRFGHSLLLFRQKIRTYDYLDNGTVVIHCSAGVGRTGTYIAVDTQLEKAKSEGIIDVYNFVHLMRTQRVNMVQTLEQYVFVYDCLLEALICGDTTVSMKAFPEVYTDLCQFDTDISKTKLEEQFEILKLLSTTIERDESTTALTPENIFKNRCKNIIPANRCRPYLMTACEDSNDYINAVFLNSYCKKDQLLVTQMPLPNTVIDFWRLVHDHKSYCLVMLNEVEKNDDTCEQYWTEDPGGVLYGPFQVETTSEIKSNPIVTVRDFTLTNIQVPGDPPRQIRQFHFHRWQEGSATPSSHKALLELVDLADTWQQVHEGPITVHCMNGASRSGLFCAALTILERVKKDKEVDVFQAVKQLRLNRTQLIDNMEQYQFCYELLMDYLTNQSNVTLLS